MTLEPNGDPVWRTGLYGELAHIANWVVWQTGLHGKLARMANWLIWRTGSYGKIAYVKPAHMAK